MGTRKRILKASGIPGTRKKAAHAAINGRADLQCRAPILLQCIERQVLGVPNNTHKIRLALASLVQLTYLHEIGKLKLALQKISDVNDKRNDIVSTKVTEAIEIANTSINNSFTESYDIALAGVIAMNLSAVRTATLTTILQTMKNSNNTSAITEITKAATDATEAGSRAVLNRATTKITNKLINLIDKSKELKNVIIEESK